MPHVESLMYGGGNIFDSCSFSAKIIPSGRDQYPLRILSHFIDTRLKKIPEHFGKSWGGGINPVLKACQLADAVNDQLANILWNWRVLWPGTQV